MCSYPVQLEFPASPQLAAVRFVYMRVDCSIWYEIFIVCSTLCVYMAEPSGIQ